MTNPATAGSVPIFDFSRLTVTPDGSTIVAAGLFDAFATNSEQYIYTLPVPANPAVDVSAVTQISVSSALVGVYDVDYVPVVSPDGSTVLATHDRGVGTNTIHTMPIAGEFGNFSFNGLFSGSSTGAPSDNAVAPGGANFNPVYNSTGSTIFFINADSGSGNTERVYSVPAGGGAAVPVTPDGVDVDAGLYDVTPNDLEIVYSPSDDTLFRVPVAGGASTAISITPGSNPGFDISSRVQVAPDGQSVFFIGDYDVEGRNELYSVPVAGGVPTKISDTLPVNGDVYSFEFAPNGLDVAYTAEQNQDATNEVFLTPITGGAGNSRRISDVPATAAIHDVPTDNIGVIAFSPDSSQVFYVGDMTTNGVNDIYVVDTTEKVGVLPGSSEYTYVGPANGDFFALSNWEDSNSTNPVAGSIPAGGDLPTGDIELDLVIDGQAVVSNGDLDFGNLNDGSLTLTNGASLSIPGGTDDLDIDPDATFVLENSTLAVGDFAFLGGQILLTNGSITAGDEVRFQDEADVVISGTTIIADDDIEFEGTDSIEINGGSFTATASGASSFVAFQGFAEGSTITGATFTSGSLSVESAEDGDEGVPADVVVTDTTFVVSGDLADGDGSDAGTLTLLGASSYTGGDVSEGADLLLGGSSTATLGADTDADAYVGRGGSTVTLLTSDSSLTLPLFPLTDTDPRDFIINGVTGLTYNQDSTTWNISDWNGEDAVTLQLLATGLPGDFNNDGMVDAADYAVWRNNLGGSEGLLNGNGDGLGVIDMADYAIWRGNFGSGVGATASTVNVPEPMAITLAAFALVSACTGARGSGRLGN